MLKVPGVVIQLSELNARLTRQPAVGIVGNQLLQHVYGFAIAIHHHQRTAFFVERVVEILRVGISAHQIVQRVNFSLVIALQPHHKSPLISRVIGSRRIDGRRRIVKTFGFGEIAVVVVAIANAVVRVGIFGLVFIGFRRYIPLKICYCRRILILFEASVAQIVPAHGVIFIRHCCVLRESLKIGCCIRVIRHAVIGFAAPVIGVVAGFRVVITHGNAVAEMLNGGIHVSVDKFLRTQLKKHHLLGFQNAASGARYAVDGGESCIIVFGGQESFG